MDNVQKHPAILVISPCYNEGEYLSITIGCMEKQTLKPSLWLIVNDGSSDNSGTIADQAAARNSDWIQVLHREPRQERSVGPGVIEAFSSGLDTVNLDDFDYVCKFDCDLEFEPGMFKGLVERMEADPALGTLSGKVWERVNNKLVFLRTGNDFSIGACKFYRIQAFKEIGGFVHEVMWDGIDCHSCRMLGWVAQSDHDKQLRLIHLRQMGSSHKSIFFGRRRWGRGQYFMGCHPFYIFAVSIYRLFEPPFILGGLNILVGYLQSMLTRQPKYNNLNFRRFLHRWQLKKLGLGFLAPRIDND